MDNQNNDESLNNPTPNQNSDLNPNPPTANNDLKPLNLNLPESDDVGAETNTPASTPTLTPDPASDPTAETTPDLAQTPKPTQNPVPAENETLNLDADLANETPMDLESPVIDNLPGENNQEVPMENQSKNQFDLDQKLENELNDLENNHHQNSNNKSKKLLLIIGGLLIIVALGALVLGLFGNNDEGEEQATEGTETPTTTEDPANLDDPSSELPVVDDTNEIVDELNQTYDQDQEDLEVLDELNGEDQTTEENNETPVETEDLPPTLDIEVSSEEDDNTKVAR